MKEIQTTGTWQKQSQDLNFNFEEIQTQLTAILNELSGGEGSQTNLQAEALKALIRGTATESSAYTDPQVQLGDFASIDDLNNALNASSLLAAKYCGRMRASLNGQNVDVLQFAVSFSDGKFSQLALGNVVPANVEGVSSRLALSATPAARILRRVSSGGVWGGWEEYGGGSSSGGGTAFDWTAIPVATTEQKGLLSAADKAKLDGLSSSSGGEAATYEVFSSTADGLAPKTGTSTALRYLRSDGTWSASPVVKLVTRTDYTYLRVIGQDAASNTLTSIDLPTPTIASPGIVPCLSGSASDVLLGTGKWGSAPAAVLPFAAVVDGVTVQAQSSGETGYAIVFDRAKGCFLKRYGMSLTGQQADYTYYVFNTDNYLSYQSAQQVPVERQLFATASDLYVCLGGTLRKVTTTAI